MIKFLSFYATIFCVLSQLSLSMCCELQTKKEKLEKKKVESNCITEHVILRTKKWMVNDGRYYL